MKVLRVLAFIAYSVFPSVGQQSGAESKDFDAVLKTSYKIYQIWQGIAFRRTVTVESRAPGHNYKLKYIFEFDPDGPTRGVYEEVVEGRAPRIPREVITINDNSYLRDVGKSSWWVSYRQGFGKFSRNGAYPSGAGEAHAVHDYYVRDRYMITSKETEVKFLGVERYDGTTARVFLKTETIKGTRKTDGSPMQSDSALKYWFGEDGVMLKSDTESKGSIGSEQYYRRIISVWKRDPSINIENPLFGTKNKRNS